MVAADVLCLADTYTAMNKIAGGLCYFLDCCGESVLAFWNPKTHALAQGVRDALDCIQLSAARILDNDANQLCQPLPEGGDLWCSMPEAAKWAQNVHGLLPILQ